MDIMLDPSIYVTNALAYSASVVRTRRKKQDYWREAAEMLTIPAVTATRTATDTAIHREDTPAKPYPHRMRVMCPEDVERYPIYKAYPLSYLSVMSRYR